MYMKLKYFFAAIVASLAMLVSCSDDMEPTYLDGLQVSSSYVAIPVDGGSTTITVSANNAWSINSENVPEWLTVSPMTGAAGETKVTFTAAGTLDGRTAVLQLLFGDDVQFINVIQGLATISPATCAEVIAGPDSKTYQVTGTVTKIANTNYGNFYLNDGTGEIYIYGTVDASGSYNWAKFGIEVGDEVTVAGPKTTYNGTVELVDATWIKTSKSLIKVASVDPENAMLPTEGGDFTVTLENKGLNLSVEVPADAQSWLSLKSVNGNTVVFHASENTAGPRSTTLVFNTTDGKKSYTAETAVAQEGLAGTHDLPFTVEEAIAYCNTLTGNSPKEVWIKGIVSKIDSQFGAQYGNGTFWISGDGVYNDGDAALDFEVFRGLWLGNQKWAEGNCLLAEGAEVLICGTVCLYNGIAETASGKAYVAEVNGVTTDANGIGTADAPFAPEGACNAAFAGCTNNVFVAGKVAKFPKDSDKFNAQYGNASFWMSADGSYTENKAVEFEAFRVLYLGNRKWVEGDKVLNEGDDVVIYGPLTTYNGTAETAGNKGYLISINGATE